MTRRKSTKAMGKKAAARIQSSEAKKGSGKVQSDSFASRAQRAAANNQKTGKK